MRGSIHDEISTATEPSGRTDEIEGAMTGTEDRYADIEVDVLDDAGVRVAINNALARAGCTWEELQEQAKAGSFSSEIARRAWFVVSSFEPSSVVVDSLRAEIGRVRADEDFTARAGRLIERDRQLLDRLAQ